MNSVKKKWFADNNKLEMWLIENCDFDSKHVDYKNMKKPITIKLIANKTVVSVAYYLL